MVTPIPTALAPSVALALAFLAGTGPAAAQDAAAAPPEPLWKGSVSLTYLATSGNAETESLGSSVAFERRPTPWGFQIAADFSRAEQDGEETAERLFGRFRSERRLDRSWSLFGGLSGERDRFAGFDLRAIFELGATRRLLHGPRHELSLDGGLTWTREDLTAGGEEDGLGAVLGALHAWQISEPARLTQRLFHYPSLEDSDDWRLHYKVDVAASLSRVLALKLAYELRYDHQPVAGFEDTDTTLSTSLVLTFPPASG